MKRAAPPSLPSLLVTRYSLLVIRDTIYRIGFVASIRFFHPLPNPRIESGASSLPQGRGDFGG